MKVYKGVYRMMYIRLYLKNTNLPSTPAISLADHLKSSKEKHL